MNAIYALRTNYDASLMSLRILHNINYLNRN